MSQLPPLVGKALADAGYDLINAAADGWTRAAISGQSHGDLLLRVVSEGTLLSMDDRAIAPRIGLTPFDVTFPGIARASLARTPQELYRALRLIGTLARHPAPSLSAEVEARLKAIPATERTTEVRRRIGQDVFRDALLEFWDGRCALSGMRLPPSLLRASHAKPWVHATDDERLDPFNGLLLATRYDALFDKGLIAFDDGGHLLVSPSLGDDVRAFVVLDGSMKLRFVLPGHTAYLRYHRSQVAGL